MKPATTSSRRSFTIFFLYLLTAPVQAETTGEDNGNTRSGEEVFNQACFSCHGTGFYGAPVIGDGYAWEERVQKGVQALFENTLNGLNSMPARGACADCSDAELEAAVRYLIDDV